MFSSFLEGSYLGSSQVGEMLPSTSPPDYPLQPTALADDLVTLPGGITLPKRTLIILAVAVAVAAIIWWRKRQQEA